MAQSSASALRRANEPDKLMTFLVQHRHELGFQNQEDVKEICNKLKKKCIGCDELLRWTGCDIRDNLVALEVEPMFINRLMILLKTIPVSRVWTDAELLKLLFRPNRLQTCFRREVKRRNYLLRRLGENAKNE